MSKERKKEKEGVAFKDFRMGLQPARYQFTGTKRHGVLHTIPYEREIDGSQLMPVFRMLVLVVTTYLVSIARY